ncbi:MAG: hypothetical protein GY710_02755 [Desulfobacteraceae bacterium]|nr:hypothetical protein [Desulfobacteraceae bacterium]
MIAFTGTAYAYIGPGIGGGLLTVLLGLVVSIFLAFFAVLWYPIKRLIKAVQGKRRINKKTSVDFIDVKTEE